MYAYLAQILGRLGLARAAQVGTTFAARTGVKGASFTSVSGVISFISKKIKENPMTFSILATVLTSLGVDYAMDKLSGDAKKDIPGMSVGNRFDAIQAAATAAVAKIESRRSDIVGDGDADTVYGEEPSEAIENYAAIQAEVTWLRQQARRWGGFEALRDIQRLMAIEPVIIDLAEFDSARRH